MEAKSESTLVPVAELLSEKAGVATETRGVSGGVNTGALGASDEMGGSGSTDLSNDNQSGVSEAMGGWSMSCEENGVAGAFVCGTSSESFGKLTCACAGAERASLCGAAALSQSGTSEEELNGAEDSVLDRS